MKKTILLLALSGMMLTVSAQQVPPAAEEVLKEAFQRANKENKNVFMIFTASWCTWCKQMDKSMTDPVCKDFFNDNYVIRYLVVDEPKEKLNLENPGSRELKTKYHGEGEGIPFWLVFDKAGSLLADSKIRKPGDGPEEGENTGCPATEAEVAHFMTVLKKTSAVTAEKAAIIRKRFRENDN